MPKYALSIEPLILLLAGNFFIVVNSGLTIPWFINKQIKARGISNIFGLLISITFLTFFWFILEQRNLNSVAIAMTLGNVFHFIYMLIIVGNQIWTSKQEFSILIVILICAGWTSLVVFSALYYFKPELNFMDDLLQTLKVSGIVLLLIAPIIIVGLKLSKYKQLIKGLN